jgi:hypothetical protein
MQGPDEAPHSSGSAFSTTADSGCFESQWGSFSNVANLPEAAQPEQ